jgi:hypothetical protein
MSDTSSEETALRAALRSQLGSARRKASGTAKGRAALEKRAMHPSDGRLKRVRDRTQFNVEIDRELKEWLSRAKRDHRMTFTEIVERGLELVRAELEGKHA